MTTPDHRPITVRAIVTDIEGTTSSLAFVHDVLFPYARRVLPGFVRRRATEPAIASALAAVRAELGAPRLDDDAVIDVLVRWMAEDRKVTALKTLQGLAWADGYRTGELIGHVYDDAARWLRQWHAAGIRLYVYSSGSVFAQRLLFHHSRAGDLAPVFRGYFDTTIGSKRDPASYLRIVDELALPGSDVAFLSDTIAELAAAELAAIRPVWLCRDATATGDRPGRHPIARDFDDVARVLDRPG